MQTAIDYEKYSNMNIRQLTNSLLSAEKQEQKIKEQMQQKQELISFLKTKIKESLDKPSYKFLTEEEAGLDKIALEVEKQIPKEEQERLEAELQDEIHRKYDEL